MRIPSASQIATLARQSGAREAIKIPKEARPVRNAVVKSLVDQMTKHARASSDMSHSSLIVNLPAPDGIGKPGAINGAVLAAWTSAFQSGANAALEALVAKGFAVHSMSASVSRYDGQGHVYANIAWGPESTSRVS